MKIGNREFTPPFVYDENFVIADADGNIIAEAVSRKNGEIDWDDCVVVGKFIADALNLFAHHKEIVSLMKDLSDGDITFATQKRATKLLKEIGENK